MVRQHDLKPMFTGVPNIVLKQRRRGCLKWLICDCCGCFPSDGAWDIYAKDKKNTKLAKADEDSSCCSRLPCCGCSCGYDIHLGLPDKDKKDRFYTFHHPFVCFSCCPMCNCSRHKLIIKDYKTNEVLGRTIADWQCCCTCHPSFSVQERPIGTEDYKEKFKVQKGFNCCERICCCCALCTKVDYEIVDDKSKKFGKMHRITTLRNAVSDADTYAILFPDKAREIDKVLLVAAGFFVNIANDKEQEAMVGDD